jgi:hypothetical protein
VARIESSQTNPRAQAWAPPLDKNPTKPPALEVLGPKDPPHPNELHEDESWAGEPLRDRSRLKEFHLGPLGEEDPYLIKRPTLAGYRYQTGFLTFYAGKTKDTGRFFYNYSPIQRLGIQVAASGSSKIILFTIDPISSKTEIRHVEDSAMKLKLLAEVLSLPYEGPEKALLVRAMAKIK